MHVRLSSILLIATAGMTSLALVGQELPETMTLKARTAVKPARDSETRAMAEQMANAGGKGSLPLWTFFVESSRDEFGYTGVMVGKDPFNGGGSAAVPTYIVPVIVVTNTVIATRDSNQNITTRPGVTTFDPTIADNSCLSAPNNVPLTLTQDSPIFQPAAFNFGGISVGKTQYVDAFQRANFWQVLGDQVSQYHVRLNPVQTLGPIVINVPAANGTSLPVTSSRYCSPLGIVDIDWFDAYLDAVVLPALVSKGVNPANLPIFLLHNLVLTFPPLTNLKECCVLGYHAINGLPIQTYAVADFENTGRFAASAQDTSAQDTAILSHEVAEWMNDPFTNNQTPPWGNVGQVIGSCANNLEVGDPLSGSEAPRIVMPNGYTYHLQELAFFSWFFGAPSIGINGWFSNNGTFLTDAGAPCQSQSSSAANPNEKWIVR